jgi:hypothetical protein
VFDPSCILRPVILHVPLNCPYLHIVHHPPGNAAGSILAGDAAGELSLGVAVVFQSALKK